MSPRPLADLLPAAARLLEVPDTADGHARADLLAGTAAQHLVILLVDGLGALQLAQHAGVAPSLSGMTDLGSLSAPFPSTTCVSLTSLGTGLPPGMHGIVGTSFRLDDGSVLAPLSWGSEPNPIATQPEPTLLERAAAAGVQVTSIAPAAHRTSGLTRAALRGGDYAGAETARDRVRAAAGALTSARAGGRRSLTYVYWPDLDKAGHIEGVDSARYRRALGHVDSLVAGLLELTGGDAELVVTADHGMVDVPDDRRLDIEGSPALRAGVATILGEPRVRHVYAEPGAAGEVLRRWTHELGSRASVRTRAEVGELLGPVDDWYADRIGDVVAIAHDDWALVSQRIDRVVSSLRGQHGALTPEEVLVPLRASWTPAVAGS